MPDLATFCECKVSFLAFQRIPGTEICIPGLERFAASGISPDRLRLRCFMSESEDHCF